MNDTIVDIRELRYSYPDGREALNGVTLDLREGETLGIIGANGAGKTTLLLHLNGMIEGAGRSVTVFGLPLEHKNFKTIRRKVGFVFQNPDDQLFSPTVFDDVAFAPLNMALEESAILSRVSGALERVGMAGYEPRSSHHLSQGEKKKIAVATVLSASCELLVLDEPTANLDPRSRRNIINLLGRLVMPKIIAGHDLGMVLDLCTRVAIMEKGRVAAQGKPREIVYDKAIMEQYGLEAMQ